MKKSALTSQIKKPTSAVLIIDKIGVVGEKLAEEFSKDYYVVLFSGRIPEKGNNRISFINFKSRIPKIPKNRYSKIFLIDDGKAITKESSFSFIKEAKNLSADFYFLGSVRNFDIKHTDELVNIYDKVKILVFGDLFDKKYLFDHNSSITKFILEAGSSKKIKVPGNGLSLSYPVNLEDTIKLILKAVYLKIPERIILLFYKSPITDLSLAHLFQKIDPDINVDFEKEFRTQNFFIPDGAEFAISKYDLKSRIEELNLDLSRKVLMKNKKVKLNNFKLFKIFGTLLLLIFFLLILPFIFSQIFLNLGEKQLKSSIEFSKNYEYSKALKKINNADSFLNLSKSANTILEKQLDLVNKSDLNKNTGLKIQNSLGLSNSLNNIYEASVLYEQIYNKENIDPGRDFNKALLMIKQSYIDLEKSNIDFTSDNLENAISVIRLLSKTLDVLPEILGFDKEKTYLILFQDSNELRPGGGKITSVAKIQLKNGTFSDFKIFDTSKLDKNLKVHVEPPFPVRRYLPSTDYLLKDSNFDPDFVESAITASALYKLETGDDIDGIISVDLYFLEYLLEKIGPIYMEEIEKNISAENIYQLSSEFETEIDSDSFTTALLKEMKIEQVDNKKIPFFLLLEIIDRAVKEKHILFAFIDQDIQNVFATNSLSGTLVDNRNNSEYKINDSFGLYEANLGLNKVNYYISRSINKKNLIDENGVIRSEILITFKNNSQRESSFAKTYKNYIQVILPNGVNISEISIGGKKQDIIPAINDYRVYENTNFINPNNLEISQALRQDKSIFGFLVSVSPDSIQTVKLNFSLPFNVSSSSAAVTNYSLLVFKQPGIESFPFNLVFEKNNNYNILPQNSYSLDIKNDEIIKSTITKK